MNKLLSLVKPSTRAIIWLVNHPNPKNVYYQEIDYLLNGLLTAKLNQELSPTPQVLINENFGNNFFVMLSGSISTKDFTHFFELISSDLEEENDILVIDEIEGFSDLRKSAPKLIANKFRIVS
jgi:hypothetical protein